MGLNPPQFGHTRQDGRRGRAGCAPLVTKEWREFDGGVRQARRCGSTAIMPPIAVMMIAPRTTNCDQPSSAWIVA